MESTSSPSMTALRSMVTKSPVLALRPTDFREPKRARRLSSSVSTSSSVTSTASTVSLALLRSGSSMTGRTVTSAVKASWPPFSPVALGSSTTSTSGWSMGTRSASVMASR